MRHSGRGWIRAGLILLAVAPLVAGAWALFLPRSFFDDFPVAARHWVSALGPGLLWPLWGAALGAATLAYYRRRGGNERRGHN